MPAPRDLAHTLAAVDLGSNSFHLVIGREMDRQLSMLDRLRDPVRLAAGLDGRGRLDEATLERMIASLSRFRQRLAGVPRGRVRAIGTNTFRRARGPADLLDRASAALGHPIEVLSGSEEARLIFLGVAHDRPQDGLRRLVVDIGGGSTECILGEGHDPQLADSMQLGCVTTSKRHFPGGKLTRKGFQEAELAAKLELETIAERYREAGWDACIGTSGTINAVDQILEQNGWSAGGIDLAALRRLRKALITAEHVEALDLPGLQSDRAPVIAGGVAILKAVLESLAIGAMQTSKAALREGLLHDLLGRIHHGDVRERTIRAFSERFRVDQDQALRVEVTALACLSQVQEDWGLEPETSEQFLGWAASLHEVGLALAYPGYHKHGEYILANANMAGFSRQEQARLAALVRGHRRKLTSELFRDLPPDWRTPTFRMCVLLRLAVRLNRTRSAEPLPPFELHASETGLDLRFPPGWLDRHPLTLADLEEECPLLEAAGMELRVR